MLVERKAAALLIMAVIVAACAPPVTASGDQTKAMMFMQVAEKSREIALELIERAKATGIDVSLAAGLVEEGSNLLNTARAAYEGGDYDSAAADAKSAQEKFREALKASGPETPSIEEQEAKPRLLEAIERAGERIGRVREALSSSTEISESLRGQIDSKLIQAEGLLSEAESILRTNVKSASEAAQRLAQAEKLISETFVALKQASHGPNMHRIEAFLNNLEREISKLRGELEKLAQRGVKVDDLKGLLSNAENLVESARGKASNGDLSGALSDIQQAREIMRQVRNEIAKRHKP